MKEVKIMNEISPMNEVNAIKNSCRCALLDYMLRQLAAKRRESELLGHPLDNPCIDEMLRSGDAVCCTMVFINFLTLCCDGCVTLTRELREIALKAPCRYANAASLLFNLPQPGQSRRKMEKERLKAKAEENMNENENEGEVEKDTALSKED